MATISRFAAVADIGKLDFEGFIAWVLWLVVHLFYIVGFKSRTTTVLHWMVSFLGRGRSQRVATQQQVYGRLALEHVGPEFPSSKAWTVDGGAGAQDAGDHPAGSRLVRQAGR